MHKDPTFGETRCRLSSKIKSWADGRGHRIHFDMTIPLYIYTYIYRYTYMYVYVYIYVYIYIYIYIYVHVSMPLRAPRLESPGRLTNLNLSPKPLNPKPETIHPRVG